MKGEKDARIRELETSVSELKVESQRINEEIKKLTEENKKLSAQTKVKKVETIDTEYWPITPLGDGLSAPEEMTYEEVSNEPCIKKAQEEYLKLGNQQCQQMGYNEADMKAWKCKLSREFIDVIQKKLQENVTACGPGY